MAEAAVPARAQVSRRPRRTPAASYIVLVALLAILVGWRVQTARDMVAILDYGDFRIFHGAAVNHLAGADMYQIERHTVVAGERSVAFDRPNLNPPHLHLLFLPLAWLPIGAALAVWGVASLASLLVCLRLIARESGLALSPLIALRGAVWLLAFAGTGALISTGQTSLFLLLPVTLGWAAARRGAWTRAGAWLGLAISMKAFLLIFLPYFLLRRRAAAALSAVLAALACFAIGIAVFGLDSHREWLALLAGVDWAPMPMNASLLGLVKRTLQPNGIFTPLVSVPGLVDPLWAVLAGVVGLVTLVLVARDESEASVDRSFALLLLAALLISPLGWTYYLWLPLGPLVAMGTRWWSGRPAPDDGLSARWRNRTVWLAAPGLFLPTFLALAFQPSRWAGLLLGSMHSWAVLLLWTGLVIDARWGAPARVPCAGNRGRT